MIWLVTIISNQYYIKLSVHHAESPSVNPSKVIRTIRIISL